MSSEQTQHTYQFDVKMTCGGCSGAITRVLQKAKDQNIITSFDVSLEKQEVLVEGDASYDTVLEMIKKTGKTVRSGKTVAENAESIAVPVLVSA